MKKKKEKMLIYSFSYTLRIIINAHKIHACRDKGPKSYIGPWVLSEDVEWSEKGQIVIRGSNLKSHK